MFLRSINFLRNSEALLVKTVDSIDPGLRSIMSAFLVFFQLPPYASSSRVNPIRLLIDEKRST